MILVAAGLLQYFVCSKKTFYCLFLHKSTIIIIYLYLEFDIDIKMPRKNWRYIDNTIFDYTSNQHFNME